ncbi:caspase-6-like [Dreissena polymorpha]|uniref:caspase-6-like n=1 Tax=Dreissena polymorpha TaxID=45954 RepID=UPI002263E765|nr:caspase-6-like [Dreissena polymorpha]
MIWTLVDVAHNTNRYNHKNYDCFVCCILTHGELNHLYGSDGQLIPLTDLTNNINVNRCPGLAGKPKLFFLQACQGGKPMGEGKVLKSDSRRSLEDIEQAALSILDIYIDTITNINKDVLLPSAKKFLGKSEGRTSHEGPPKPWTCVTSSLRKTCNTNVSSSTTSSTLRKLSTACGMMAYSMF